MSFMTVLDLSHYAILHYLEDRDDGLHHVFKSQAEEQYLLDIIVSKTQFTHDKTALGLDWSVSVPSNKINSEDIASLKKIFPRGESIKVERDSVIHDRKTRHFDMSAYEIKSTYQSITPELDTLDHYNDLVRLMESYLAVYNLTDEHKSTITDLNTRVFQGEFSKDTFPLWRLFFRDEKRALSSLIEVHDSPVLSACYEWIKSDLLIARHPGYYFAKSAAGERNYLDYNSEIVTRISARENIPGAGVIELANVIDLSRSNGASEIAYIDQLKPGHIMSLSESVFNGFGTEAKSPVFIQSSDAIIVAKLYEFNRRLALVNGDISLDEKVLLGASVAEQRTDVLDYMAQSKRGRVSLSRKENLSVVGLRNFIRTIYPTANEVPDSLKMALQDTDKLIAKARTSIDELFLTKIESIAGHHSDENIVVLRQMLAEMNALIYATQLSTNVAFDDIIDGKSFELTGSHFSNEKFGEKMELALLSVLSLYKTEQKDKEDLRIETERESARKTLHNTIISPSESVQSDLLNDSQINTKHIDVGEKFGGARKDNYARITSSNILELTFDEKISFTTKAKIWPKPDWAQLIEDGMQLEVAAVIRKVRNTISPVAEQVSSSYTTRIKYVELAKTDDDIVSWVNATEMVRDKLMGCRTKDDLEVVLKALRDDLHSNDAPRDKQLFHALGNSWRKFYSHNQGFLRELRSIEYIKNYNSPEAYERHVKVKLLGIKPAKQVSTEEQTGTVKAVDEKKKLLAPLPAHLKNVTRTGPDWRKGVDITGDQLMDTFGFKGIEYGNWVANKERQVVLNHAFDAFMDLSNAIGLGSDHLKMIGFDGHLGIGFGSRGTGKAMAHYEPLRSVINLTKIKGAGSLAHEWMHALDDHIGKLTGTRSPREGLFSTSQFKQVSLAGNTLAEILTNIGINVDKRLKQVNPDIDQSLINLAGSVVKMAAATRIKDKTLEDKERQVDLVIDKAIDHFAGWSKFISNRVLKEYASDFPIVHIAIIDKDFMKSQYQVYRASPKTNKDGEDFFTSVITKAILDHNPILTTKIEELKALADSNCKKHSSEQLTSYYLSSRLETHIECILESAGGLIETQYFDDAIILDGKLRKYWTEPHEMIARAFAVAVNDSLTTRNIQSDYLVRGSSRNEFSDRTIYKANANPEGQERAMMTEQFDEVFKCFYAFAAKQSEQAEEVEDEGCSVTMR